MISRFWLAPLMQSEPTGDIVTPWEVKAGSDTGVDYNKLLDKFGCSEVDDALINLLENAIKVPAHHLLRRRMFFSHRELDNIIERYKHDKPFYLYTGRGPSSTSLHIGHLIPFIMTKWIQEAFDVPLVIQLTDDEKYLWQNLTLEQSLEMGRENARDIVAVGFDPNKTFIFSDFQYMGQCPEFYQNVVRVQRLVTFNQIRGIFGFNDSENIGKLAFPA
ncbi:unnamed protein product, partial [Protopolystoma xenopodis]